MQEYRIAKHRGQWSIVYYRDGRRHRRALGTADIQTARASSRYFIERIEAGERPQDPTIGDIVGGYLDQSDKPAAVVWRFHWRSAAPLLSELRPAELTETTCKSFAAERGVHVKPGTIRKELGLVRAALGWAKKKQWIVAIPHVYLPAAPPPRNRRLTREEADRLQEAARLTPHLYVFVALARHTAARSGAILGLSWGQVDLDRGRIDLGGREGQKGRAIIPINETLGEALREARGAATSPFVVEYGGRPVKSIKKAFKAAAARAGLQDVSPHVLRHSVATWLAEAGRPFEEIAQFLGHTDPRLTYRIYARYSPEHLQTAAKTLG